jgi:ATP-dependent RNA helicase SUPV3L1/SUV3
VRVDILERLADLIRPALAWREGAAARPLGAVLGGGFTVVNTMTSLIGASGEDFASILRSLGYRMERRPKPSEPPPAAVQPPSEAVASEAPSETALDAASDLSHEAVVPVDCGNAPPDLATAPLATDLSASAQETSAQETSAQETPAGSGSESTLQSAAEPAEAAQESASAVAPTTATDGGEAALPTEQAMPTEQEMIEVWRPGRIEGRRRAHARPHGRAKQARIKPSAAAPEPAQDGKAAQTQTTALPATTDLASEGAHARPRQPFRQRRKPEHRTDRQQRERPPGKRFERREKMPDPNSPFAKLASLKAQLEADAKERR